MAEPYDIAERIRTAASEAIRECAPAEEFGYSVSMGAVQAQTGQDVIVWILLIACRSPLLGQPDLGATSKFAGNTVSDADVSRAVRESVKALRDQFAQILRDGVPGGNGHVPAAYGTKP